VIVQAILAFLDLYALGPDNELTKNVDYESVWLLLLHGWYTGNNEDLPGCFGAKDVQFLDEFKYSSVGPKIVVPYFLNRRKYPNVEPVSWLFCEKNGREGRKITRQEVKSWYEFWVHFIQGKFKNGIFPIIAKYFAFLSLSLFGASIKQPESVEKFISLSFDAIFNSCIYNQGLPAKINVPAIDKIVRKIVAGSKIAVHS
jgi:hypothetical protein